MSYTNNPKIPEVRMQAVQLVREGWSARKTARHLGFAHNTVLNWLKQVPVYGPYNRLVIPTRSCKPHHHPSELPREVVARILTLRRERSQCAEILHHRLQKEGVLVSLSSVKRVLKRHGCTRFSPWKKWHQYPARPLALKPGVLVQMDSMHEGLAKEHLFAYALLDVCSRWGFAASSFAANSRKTSLFLHEAQNHAPFRFQTIQTDHGSEFGKWFTKVAEHGGVSHRHSRVRTPTDNGHVERFIRTLQDECLHRIPRKLHVWKKEIPDFLHYYNTERPHMALNYKTPLEVVRSY